MLKVVQALLILAAGHSGFAPDQQSSKTQPNDRSFQVLIKKKDVNDYYAARKGRHPLSGKPASAPEPAKSAKRGSKPSTSPEAIDLTALDLRVPPFTIQPCLSDTVPPGAKSWTKA